VSAITDADREAARLLIGDPAIDPRKVQNDLLMERLRGEIEKMKAGYAANNVPMPAYAIVHPDMYKDLLDHES